MTFAPASPVLDLVCCSRLSSVLDIGANPIDGDPPYKRMLESGLCTVTGFEPQRDALAELERRKGGMSRRLLKLSKRSLRIEIYAASVI